MTDLNQKKEETGKGTGNVIAAGVTGAVVGAGVVAAAAMALKNEKNRKKVNKVIADVKHQATDYIKTLKKDPNVKKGIAKIQEVVKDVKNVGKKAKK